MIISTSCMKNLICFVFSIFVFSDAPRAVSQAAISIFITYLGNCKATISYKVCINVAVVAVSLKTLLFTPLESQLVFFTKINKCLKFL